jgi:hypothetical protein
MSLCLCASVVIFLNGIINHRDTKKKTLAIQEKSGEGRAS